MSDAESRAYDAHCDAMSGEPCAQHGQPRDACEECDADYEAAQREEPCEIEAPAYPGEHKRAVEDHYVEWSIPSASSPIKGPPMRMVMTADFGSGLIEIEDIEVTSTGDAARALGDGRRDRIMLTKAEARWLLARLPVAMSTLEDDGNEGEPLPAKAAGGAR